MCYALFMPMGDLPLLDGDKRGVDGEGGSWEVEKTGGEEGGEIIFGM